MEFLVVLVVTVVAVLALREPLRRWPAAFYVLAAVAVVLYFAGVNGLLDGSWWKPAIALVLVLGVTSFNFVKHRMGGRAWKNVQRLAYPFFGLAWVHLVFMLAPAAAKGGEQAVLSVAIYTVLFAAYAILRVFRWVKDGRAELAPAAETAA